MAGFRYVHRLSGGNPTIETLKFNDSETLTKGDMVNLESGNVDLLAGADTNALGVVLETKAGSAGVTEIRVITDADAIYEVTDANARVKGATLDITGATGAQGVTASSNKNFVVDRPSSNAQPTRVRFNVGKHHYNTAL